MRKRRRLFIHDWKFPVLSDALKPYQWQYFNNAAVKIETQSEEEAIFLKGYSACDLRQLEVL